MYAYDEPPELIFPTSVSVYDKMGRTDAQVAGVTRAVTLPILSAKWSLDPTDAREEVTVTMAEDLGLPILGAGEKDRPERRSRFSWTTHLRQALRCLRHGFSVFEIVGYIADDGRIRLRKLSPRPALSIAEFVQDDDGGLVAVKQWTRKKSAGVVGGAVPIPVSQLVVYVNDQEPGSWEGTALALDTPIPSPDGWTTMGDIQVGDRVFDEMGKIRYVIDKSPVMEDHTCYRVDFGLRGQPRPTESIVADADHRWLSQQWRRAGTQGVPGSHRGPTLVTTAEMAASGATRYGYKSHAVTPAEPVEYVAQSLAVDPYVLGFWLGDGCATSGVICTPVSHTVDEFALRGYPLRPSKLCCWQAKGLTHALSSLGVLRNKHVPEHYLRGSIAQRLDLLRGLMDSDGSVSVSSRTFTFTNINYSLMSAVRELVVSLGGLAGPIYERHPSTRARYGRAPIWALAFRFPTHPFLLPSKRAKCEKADQERQNTRYLHYVRSVEQVESVPVACITVDSPSSLYLAGKSMVPTHNSIYRPAFGPWVLKERALRVWAMSIERNGLGMPLGEPGENAGDSEIQFLHEMAQAWRAGETAGGVVGKGSSMRLVGVEGTLPDIDAHIRYMDGAIAKGVLAQFLDLGATRTGSRALSMSFIDFFRLSIQAIMKEMADVANNHVVADLVELNYGPDEAIPRIVPAEANLEESLPPAELARLIQVGAVIMDDRTERWTRERFRMPEHDPSTARQPPSSAGAPGGTPPDDDESDD